MAGQIQEVEAGTDAAGMDKIGVGLHDPLGKSRCAACVHEHGDFIFKDIHGQFRRRGLLDHFLEIKPSFGFLVGRPEIDEVLGRRNGGFELLGHSAKLLLADQQTTKMKPALGT